MNYSDLYNRIKTGDFDFYKNYKSSTTKIKKISYLILNWVLGISIILFEITGVYISFENKDVGYFLIGIIECIVIVGLVIYSLYSLVRKRNTQWKLSFYGYIFLGFIFSLIKLKLF